MTRRAPSGPRYPAKPRGGAPRRWCPYCGGEWSWTQRHYLHRPDCAVLSKEAHTVDFRAEVEAREAPPKVYPDDYPCSHGYQDLMSCPACCEEADRAWKERTELG